MNQWSEEDEKNRTRDLIVAFVCLIILLVFMFYFYTHMYNVYKHHNRTEQRIESTYNDSIHDQTQVNGVLVTKED